MPEKARTEMKRLTPQQRLAKAASQIGKVMVELDSLADEKSLAEERDAILTAVRALETAEQSLP